MQNQPPLKIFIVYAREDAEALKELRVQFIPVARSERLEVWYDGEILPGQHWDQEIKAQLQSADIILLFISKYFFASEYIQTTELKAALARHEAGQSVVVPVIVRPCVWQDAFEVSRFQALPAGAQAIFSSAWRDHDEAMVSVVEGVKKVARNMRIDRADLPLVEKQKNEREYAKTEKAPPIIKKQLIEEKETSEQYVASKNRFSLVGPLIYLGSGLLALILIWFLAQKFSIKLNNPNERISQNHQDSILKKDDNQFSIRPDSLIKTNQIVPQGKEEKNNSHSTVSPSSTLEIGVGGKSGFEMVSIHGGLFRMGQRGTADPNIGCEGCSGGECGHDVTVSSFNIGKYEVTEADWREIMGSDPSTLEFKDCPQCPVNQVSWNDVQDFIKKLNIRTQQRFRLPTEEEWEFAARGGTKSKRFEYSGSDEIGQVGWYQENSGGQLHEVGQKKPNELGLFDMSGNIDEWCADPYKAYPCDVEGPVDSSGRIMRGGSFAMDDSNCRVTNRFAAVKQGKLRDFGFRLARD